MHRASANRDADKRRGNAWEVFEEAHEPVRLRKIAI
jgi:hypothetical protein